MYQQQTIPQLPTYFSEVGQQGEFSNVDIDQSLSGNGNNTFFFSEQQHQQQDVQQPQGYSNNNNSNNVSIAANNGVVSTGDFHSMLMAANNNINGNRTVQQPQQQQQQQANQIQQFTTVLKNNNNNPAINNQINKLFYNIYGTDEQSMGYLPFSDEKKLILLSALGADANILLQQQQQQQQPQQQNFQSQNQFQNFQQQQQQQQPNNLVNNLYGQSFNQPIVQQQPQSQQQTIPTISNVHQQHLQQQQHQIVPPMQVHAPAVQQQHFQSRNVYNNNTVNNNNQVIAQQQHQTTQAPTIPTPVLIPPTTQQKRVQPPIVIPQPIVVPQSQQTTPTISSVHQHHNNNNNNSSTQQPPPQPQQQPQPRQQPQQQQQPIHYSLSPPVTPSSNHDSYLYGLEDDSHLTEKQKSRRRASQNLASRNYRQRKKQYMSEIETKLEIIVLENEKLKNELHQAKKLINKLLTENNALKGDTKKKSDIPGCTGEEDDEEDIFDGLTNSNINTSMDDMNSSNGFTNNSEFDQFSSSGGILNNEQEQEQQLVTNSSSDELPQDISTLIDRLEAGMKITEGSDLTSTLKSFYDTLKNRQNIYVKQIKQIVNPCTQAKLALLDLDINSTYNDTCRLTQIQQQQAQQQHHQDPNSPINSTPGVVSSPLSIMDVPSSPAITPLHDLQPTQWLLEFIQEASVSDEQEIRIRTLRQESFYKHSKLLKDRQHLNRDIRDYFQSKVFKHLIKRNNAPRGYSSRATFNHSNTNSSSSSISNNNNTDGTNEISPQNHVNSNKMDYNESSSPVGQSYITELGELLDSLKDNLDQENILLLKTYEQLGSILSPHQEALLITKVYNNISSEDGFSNVQMLHGIWDYISISYESKSTNNTSNLGSMNRH